MAIEVEKIKPPLSEEKEIFEVISYLQARQRALELLSPYRSEVCLKINGTKLPIRIIHVGDTHLGHDHANPNTLLEVVKQTSPAGAIGHEKANPDPLGEIIKKNAPEAPIVLQGNIIDGVSDKFISTNTIHVGMDLDGQRRLAKAILKGKPVIPVSANTCHEGWAKKKATHDPTTLLVDDNVPILYTGGQVILTDEENELGRIEVYHNPGKGNTQQSPEGAIRSRYREIASTNPNSPNAIISAHTHKLVAGQDVSKNPMTREDRLVTLGVVGTAKGTKNNPDMFLVGLGVPPRNQPADAGQGLVTIWRYDKTNERMKSYPVAGFDRATILYEAVLLWELARRANALEDLQGLINESSLGERPSQKLRNNQSFFRESDPAAKSEGKAPLYKTLTHEITTQLPISIQFIANIRIGSTSFQRTVVNDLLEEIEENPWRFWVATRRLINQGVAQQQNRFEILVELANVLKRGKNSLLGLMLTDELRLHAWGKPIGSGEEKINPIIPGDWLYYQSPIMGTPIIMPETVMNIYIGDILYQFYIKDRLSHLTSLINPFHGLTRISEIWGIDADALIGGNTEVIGWRTWMKPTGQLEIVVPGGFSEYIEKGIGNRVDYPSGGQGIVIFPGKKLVYSFATKEDLKDYHEALWLFEALNKLNTEGKLSLKYLKEKFGLNKRKYNSSHKNNK